MAITAVSAPRCRIGIPAALAAIIAIGILTTCLRSIPALAETTSSGCHLYASTSGSDSNPGTASAPFATAKHLLEKLSARETGCLASGQTFAGFTLYAGNTHGAKGEPVTLTSTNPEVPAIIDSRVTTEKGTDWLTFTHLILKADVLNNAEEPSPTIDSAHTTWTYDDISGGGIDICLLTGAVGDSYGTGEYTLIEGDRVHDCGHPLTREELECQGVSKLPVCTTENVDIYESRLNGWHAHGIYDEGTYTTVRNSYFYDNSSKGILLRGGTGAVIEHNVIDHNGSGLLFGDDEQSHATVAWNLITNSTSPCAKEAPTGYKCDSFGIWSYNCLCTGDVVRNNDVYGNEGGNIAPPEDLSSEIKLEHNFEVDPLYVNAAAHEYTLQADSPALGYGPDTAPPTSTPPPTTIEPITPMIESTARPTESTAPTTLTTESTAPTPPPTTDPTTAPKRSHPPTSRKSRNRAAAARLRSHRRGHRGAKIAKRRAKRATPRTLMAVQP
jgi:Right handed beta helix region